MKTIVLTGASDGIGAAAAAHLTRDGHRVLLVGRTESKLAPIAEKLKAPYFVADYERLSDVRRLAAELRAATDRIDVLANNAGGIFHGPLLTEDGFERTFQVNHLAAFLLVHELMDLLLASRAAVINTSSAAAKTMAGTIDLDNLDLHDGFATWRAYGNAKLANILFARGLHARYHEEGISAMAFHPGVIASNFGADIAGPVRVAYHSLVRVVLTSAVRGGATLAHWIEGTPGETWQSDHFYTSSWKLGTTNPQAWDDALVRAHWDASAALLGLTD